MWGQKLGFLSKRTFHLNGQRPREPRVWFGSKLNIDSWREWKQNKRLLRRNNWFQFLLSHEVVRILQRRNS